MPVIVRLNEAEAATRGDTELSMDLSCKQSRLRREHEPGAEVGSDLFAEVEVLCRACWGEVHRLNRAGPRTARSRWASA
jgi:hypothetical protein